MGFNPRFKLRARRDEGSSEPALEDSDVPRGTFGTGAPYPKTVAKSGQVEGDGIKLFNKDSTWCVEKFGEIHCNLVKKRLKFWKTDESEEKQEPECGKLAMSEYLPLACGMEEKVI